MPKQRPGLNSRQHRFCLNILAGMPPQEAYANAGYSDNPVNLATRPYDILHEAPQVRAFIEEKRKQKEALVLAADVSNTIASPSEVKQVLTDILRGNVFDHIGEDSDVVPNRQKPVAVKEYSHRRRVDYDGNPVVTKELKLESKLEAARELAKIHGMYAPSKHLVAQKVQLEITHVKKVRAGEDEP